MKSRPEKGNAPMAATTEASSVKTQEINQGINMFDSTQDGTGRAITVPFHGTELYVVEHNGQPYTPMKPIVTAMGLDWKSQHRKVATNQARWGMEEISIPSTMVDSTMVGSADGKNRALTCIPVRKVAAWLTTIEPGKIKNPEVRARVIQYQNECDDVLWQYWNDGAAINPRAFSVHPGQTLSQEQADTLRNMLTGSVKKLPLAKQAGAMVKGWSKLKSHFKTDYRHIPAAEFHEAVNILARHIAEWEVVDDAPPPATDNEKIKHAYALASEVAKQAAMTVFNAVVDDQDVHKHDRWMFHMDWHARDGVPAAWAKPVEGSAMVVSMADLPRRLLEPNGMLPTNKELADLATACNQRLAQRLQHEATAAQRLAA